MSGDGILVIEGWDVDGPHFKDGDSYLSKDGTNPEAASPGYGWPLGSECWYYVLLGQGWRLHATGTTVEKAADRARAIAGSDDPARLAGAIR
jgi:hypothetical protein